MMTGPKEEEEEEAEEEEEGEELNINWTTNLRILREES
jgi:hypothetical protein